MSTNSTYEQFWKCHSPRISASLRLGCLLCLCDGLMQQRIPSTTASTIAVAPTTSNGQEHVKELK